LACARTCARPYARLYALITSFCDANTQPHHYSSFHLPTVTTFQLSTTYLDNHDYDKYTAYSDSDTFSDLYTSTASIAQLTFTIERQSYGCLRHPIYPLTTTTIIAFKHPQDDQTRDNHLTDTIIGTIKHQLCTYSLS
jgi:hypothetical protein